MGAFASPFPPSNAHERNVTCFYNDLLHRYTDSLVSFMKETV